MPQPLILTLELGPTAQAFYEALRQRYFPPDRNLIPAHLTLFHQLPDEDPTHQTLERIVANTTAFALTRPTPRSIGRGVAVFFESPPLLALHATLAQAFAPNLIPQDRQRFQPHIVIQNKVAGESARQTLALTQAMPLIEAQATGLSLWRYLGGPWESVCALSFFS